jgi:hypothetical protein
MEVTARYGLPLLVAGQGQKEITHNEALLLLDAAVSCVVERRDLLEPPIAPLAGQCWLVPAGASFEWEGRAGQIATWTEGGWRYLPLPEGAALYVKVGGERLRRMGGSWQADGLSGAPLAQISGPAGGVTIDSEARAAVNAILERMRTLGLIQS